LLPKGAQFVVQWRYGDKERESLCVRHEVAEVDTAGRDRAKELFSEVVEYHGFEIEEMEVAADHVHIFISLPPK
jgi:REP element-mobilizing transposase RayT